MDLKKKENILELIKFQKRLIKDYYHYINDLIKTKYKNAALLSYWLRDYLHFLKSEQSFNPKFNIKYKRGQIVYVNFGYRIGSELGGCHYAIVLDVINAKTNSQLTVIPMKSKRDNITNYSKIYHVDLGSEIQELLIQKSCSIIKNSQNDLNKLIDNHNLNVINDDLRVSREIEKLRKQLTNAQKAYDFAKNRLNHNSIADIGQICTISKIRILHPTKKYDALTDVCLSSEAMQHIQERIQYLFFDKKG